MKTLSNNTRIMRASIVILMAIVTLGSVAAQKAVTDYTLFTNTVQVETIINKSFNAVKNVFNSSAVEFEMEVEYEAAMEIETWMLDAESWESDMINEPAMELESWMVSTGTWETKSIEDELVVEDWMFNFHENIEADEVTAEPELALEEWMLNPDGWNR